MKWQRPVLMWAGFTLLLLALSYFIPDGWFTSVKTVYKVEEKPTAFSTSVEDQEVAFDEDAETFLSVTNLDDLVSVAIRKLLRQANLNETEMESARDVLVNAFHRVLRTPEHIDGIAKRTSQQLDDVLPRMNREKVDAAILPFFKKLKVSPGGSPKPETKCSDCHSQMRLLPGDAKFDSVGIYPGAEQTIFRGGRAFPVMNEFLEIEQSISLLGAEATPKTECLDCHVGHEDPKHTVGKERRKENLGFWLNLDSDPIPNMLDVEVKLKSFESAHKVPAGKPSRAYVIVLDAFDQNDKPLKLWFGETLPPNLSKRKRAGVLFAKRMFDAAGQPTSDPSKVKTFSDDDRLEHGRFSGDHFLYMADGVKSVRVVATLYYLPNFTEWNGAEEIFKIEKKQ